MFSSPAAIPADANEPINNSSFNESFWSSWDPHFTPSSGTYVNNYWSECYYAPAYYEQQNFADYYQPVYFNNVYCCYCFYEYPVTTYFVPVFYYPVPATATFVVTPDVPSEYDDEHDISYVNDFGYATLESSFADYYQSVYFNNVVYYGFYEYPVTTYFVPVFYYPVPAIYTTTFVGTPVIPSEYEDEDDISYVNDFGYEILKNRDSSLGEKTPTNPDCVNESSAYKKFCSEMEERRKILGASSQAKRTFVNRGIVKDVLAYNNFCRSVEDRMKKTGSSSEGKKTCMNRDSVYESPNYIKFCSEVEDRRKILDSSSVRQKTYVNRGIVSDSSSYRTFCQSVEERIKNRGSVETSPSSGIKKFIDKESSKGDGVVYEEHGLNLMDMILNSSEYLHVKDNIENPKYYRDLLYRQALKNNPRRNKTALFDILPSIFEESSILDDVTAGISCGDPTVIGPEELVFKEEITKSKQRKGRWKRFRNWWSKTFCCGCKSKDPP